MNATSRTFRFNTAISAINELTGKFDEDAHRLLILPLRGRIMQIDGVWSLEIGRYELTVKWRSDVTDEATVTPRVIEAVEWAAGQPGFFPLRGEKTPVGIPQLPPPPAPPHKGRLYVGFGSSVIAFPASETSDGSDDSKFRHDTQSLVDELTNIDGITDIMFRLHEAVIWFDTDIIPSSDVATHVLSVLTAATQGSKFFPYILEGEELTPKLVFSLS